MAVVLRDGPDRRLRGALAPWSPRISLAEAGPGPAAAGPVGRPTLLLCPGVILPAEALAALEAVMVGLSAPQCLVCRSGQYGDHAGTGRSPGLFGITLQSPGLASSGRAPPGPGGGGPVGAVLLPAGAMPLDPADGAAVAALPRLEAPGLRGAPVPPGVGSDDRPCLGDLVDSQSGCPAIVVGNGPSLRDRDVAVLARSLAAEAQGEATLVTLNGAWRAWREWTGPRARPLWHVVEDRLVAEAEAAALRGLSQSPGPGPTLILPQDHADLVPSGPGRLLVPVDWSWYGPAGWTQPHPGFATTADGPLHAGQTVVYLAVQLAFLAGCDPVVLVGMDLDYRLPPSARVRGRVVTSTRGDPNHHPAGAYGPGRHWHLPKPDRMLAALRHAAAVYTAHGRRLVNATPGGRLTGIERRVYGDRVADDEGGRPTDRQRHASTATATPA